MSDLKPRVSALEYLIGLVLARRDQGTVVPTLNLATPTYLDPQSASGHATDDGPATLAEPLLTSTEFNRRAAATTLLTGQNYELVLLSDAVLTDPPLSVAKTFFQKDATFEIVGQVVALTAPSTFTAVTPLDPTTPVGGTRFNVQDTAANFTAAQDLVLVDLTSPGLFTIKVIESETSVDCTGFGTVPSHSYVVARYTRAVIGDMRYIGASEPATSFAAIQYTNVDCVPGSEATIFQPAQGKASPSLLLECQLHQAMAVGDAQIILEDTDAIASGGFFGNSEGMVRYIGAGSYNGSNVGLTTAAPGFQGTLVLDAGVWCYNVDGPLIIGSNGEGPANGGSCTLPFAQLQEFTSGAPTLDVQAGAFCVAGLVCGTVNTGVGFFAELGATIQLAFSPPNLAAASDFGLGGATVGFGVDHSGPFPVFTPPLALTWALFTTPTAGGGYGGSAQNIDGNAHIVLNGSAP